MSYSVADVDQAIAGITSLRGRLTGRLYRIGTADWEMFHSADSSAETPIGTISDVASYGGEGQGDDYWVVVKVTAPDGSERFFRRDGWYQSHSGSELDGETYEVRPRERMVTFYE